MAIDAKQGGPERPAPGSVPSERAAKQASDPSLSDAGTYFLGRYRIVDEIGIGGMASVHLARADGPGGFQKWVAIKRIHRHLAEDENFIRMFLDEARIAARISHPNVAQVFDLGKHRDTYWIAMEYLHGDPLRESMRAVEEGGAPPMSASLAAKVISDAAEGLHAAHELRDKDGKLLNLVHRDVTPHNLFLTYDGAVKVVDFGIAKVTGRLSNTRAGTLKGKIAYMSPEQVRGVALDRRTDVFALGVVLWELTTGKRLFRTESEIETLERVQACIVPPPSTMIENCPIELEAIVMRALSKDLEKRFPTTREMSRALQQYLMHEGAFVGPEEVGGYVKQVLADRFQKREEHLQWAAEVTQTVSLESLKERSLEALEDVSILTDVSDIQEMLKPPPPSTRKSGNPAATSPVRGPGRSLPPLPSSTRPAAGVQPRPAAGAPPPRPSLASSPSVPRSATPLPASRSRPLTIPIAPKPPSPRASSPFLPSYDENTTTKTEDLLEPDHDVRESARLSPARGKATMLGIGPSNAQPDPPELPSYDLNTASISGPTPVKAVEPVVAPGASPYLDDDDNMVTRVVGSLEDEPHSPSTVSTVHAPFKSVRPVPPPPEAVLVAEEAVAPPERYSDPPPIARARSAPAIVAPVPAPSHELRAAAGRASADPVVLARPDTRPVLIALIAAATTLIALALTALVVLQIVDREPRATPAAAPAAATTAPAAARTPARATDDDQPVDLSSLPTEPRAHDKPREAPPNPAPRGNLTSPAPATKSRSPSAPSASAPRATTDNGYLTMVCDPFCDSISAAGRSLGPSPVVRAALPPGTHSVSLRRKGSPSKAITITIVSGQTTARRVKMTP